MILVYCARTGALLGQAVQVVGATTERNGFVRVLSAAGYSDVHRSLVTLEVSS